MIAVVFYILFLGLLVLYALYAHRVADWLIPAKQEPEPLYDDYDLADLVQIPVVKEAEHGRKSR